MRGGADCTLTLNPSYSGEEKKDNKIWCNEDDCAKESRYTNSASTIQQKVTYLNNDSRKAFELRIHDGKLYNFLGKPVSTDNGKDGKYIFVWGKDNKIYASAKNENYNKTTGKLIAASRFHHSSFLAGEPVACAGYITINNGVIESIQWVSGHYLPTSGTVCKFLTYLENNKINVGNILLIPYKKDPMQRDELCKEDNCDEYNYS